MRKLVSLIFSMLLVSSAANASEGSCNYMPPNNLDKEDSVASWAGITQDQFNAVIDRAVAIYEPLIKGFGGKLIINRRWSDSTVNASALQTGSRWEVNMYGGLARRAEVTEDGFAMVLCHEIGHHIGGYPYVQGWASNEGQSDMHATGACATKLFTKNQNLADTAGYGLPDDMIAKCDEKHATAEARDICYRAVVAGKSLGDLLAALGGGQEIGYDTPDTRVVKRTNNAHPQAQCRLDTYIASALCGSEKWDYSLIPGKNAASRNSKAAQDEAYAHSCVEGEGARPKCWFAQLK